MQMDYLDLGNTYIIRLDPGDEIIQSLESFCVNSKIKSGKVMGIGAIRDTKIAYFDPALGDY
jgi:predicted DNA-binding protein with PD1-like motif